MSRRPLSNTAAIAVVSMIFFTWGGLTSLNDVLIPHLKAVFQMNYAQSMLIQFTFFGAYFLMSLPAGAVVARVGYKASIVIGLVVAAIGAAMFYPAARLPSYPLFLTALFVLASGITLLQVAANPYISLIGEPGKAPSRLNFAQALNSLGTTTFPWLIGPLILAGVVLGADQLTAMNPQQLSVYRIEQARSVEIPYLMLAGGLLLLALFVVVMRIPSLRESGDTATESEHGFMDSLRHPHLRWGVLGIFMYVGAEVSIGSFLINYIAEPGIGALTESKASGYLSLYWLGAMIGRFAGAALLQVIPARKLLAAFAGVASLLLIVTMISSGHVAMWSVIAIGLFNSIMFPTIFTVAIERLGPLTSKASSLLIMGIVGGAIVPLVQGALADVVGIQHAFVIPLLCYAYILWYGLRGSRLSANLPAEAPGATPAARAMH
ncbi:sugar MFS transporter [Xanthomonas hyacinthi]|uniref:Glucose/galactose MFS transporter n=1 Tax=Xanthomonas hyacinthi TaxID=56455 RepID=A0A2S7EW89_9XANT|nr:sugar MFS transporter [Xanthomonas hyacinthi]KLD77595.1 major facilitator transporter [Xanthomonas hyacinthi DSM 19077]PPU97369.1 glucose/galactose MFS transporter [Xanthomonas hyacinthi]QGY76323.1 sugar MFS transporter [Xanthomonas hyacinthi]